MITDNKKKIKKLGKTHIWPAILFLLFSLLLAFATYAMFVALMVANQMSERFSYVCANALTAINSFDAAEDKTHTLMKNMQENPLALDAILIYDENGDLLTGYGEPTYDKRLNAEFSSELFEQLLVNVDFTDNYELYIDRDTARNLLGTDGSLHLDYILEQENFSVFYKGRPKSDDILFAAKFWIKAPLSDNRSIMIKCTAPLYLKDFEKATLFGTIACITMLIPVFFFFINLIINVHRQRRTTKLLYTDSTTGGHNYIYFEHNGGKLLSARRNRGKPFLIADVTVTKYRSYCNYHGIHNGEELLTAVDKELSVKLYRKKEELCAHIGKSSFVIIARCPGKAQGEARLRSIIGELSEKFAPNGVNFHAGVYFLEGQKLLRKKSERPLDPADCLSRASAARACLTDENAAAVEVYNDKLLEEQIWTHKVEEKMQAALDNEEFKVYLQPKYNPVTEELAGAEALIRWINAEDGFISPGRFIPIFENNGFITKIDDYMLSHVARLQAQWLAEGRSVVPVSVNISRAHFANPDLAQHICTLVDQYQVPHDLIEIELTESAFFDDKAALLRTVHQLREMGFEISMDDFGAGYSSLNSLKDLPLDVLKLDAEFFRGENAGNRGEIVVSQAIQLAKSLNMHIVAEGVEKKEQVDFLAGQGCDMIQGFYFAKPMPADEYEQKLSPATKEQQPPDPTEKTAPNEQQPIQNDLSTQSETSSPSSFGEE